MFTMYVFVKLKFIHKVETTRNGGLGQDGNLPTDETNQNNKYRKDKVNDYDKQKHKKERNF